MRKNLYGRILKGEPKEQYLSFAYIKLVAFSKKIQLHLLTAQLELFHLGLPSILCMKMYQLNYKALGYKSKISIKAYRFIYSGVKSPLPVVTIEFKKKKKKRKKKKDNK